MYQFNVAMITFTTKKGLWKAIKEEIQSRRIELINRDI